MSQNVNKSIAALSQTVGVILAGGRSKRMGGQDKSQLLLGGRPLIDHVIKRAGPQVSRLIINAPENNVFDKYDLPVVEDSIPGFAGPLAGVLAALQWTSQNLPDARWLASFPTDAPFFPDNLVQSLAHALAQNNDCETAFACWAEQDHPVFALWPVNLKDDLERAIKIDGVARVGQWFEGRKTLKLDFSTHASNPDVDCFLNINTAHDLQAAETMLADKG